MQTARNRLTFVIAVAIATLLATLVSLGAQFAGAQHAGEPSLAAATVPSMMSYQGRVLASGVPFNGTGYFKFAVLNAVGIISFWSNDGSSSAGSEPTAAVTITVSNGLFTLLLGDTTLPGMTQPLSATVFADADRRLRIWFSPTNAGVFTPLLPDQPLTAAPFAFNAQALGGLDASTYVQQADLGASGFVTRNLADARYARISPTTQQLALLKWYTAISGTQADFGVGALPFGIAFDGANMWVTNHNSASVSVLRASDGFHVMTLTVAAFPGAIAFDGANMWVVDHNGSRVRVLRASDGFPVRTVIVGFGPQGIAYDGANMWVANGTDGTVSVVRAGDGFLVRTHTVGTLPAGIAFDGVNMWVVNTGGKNVSVLRASDGFHVMTPTVGSLASNIAFDGANMWVPNGNDNTVSVLHAGDGFHVMTPTVGLQPAGISFDGANMWVVSENDNTVSVLRASDGFHVMTPTVGSAPGVIAFDGAFMWVANAGGNSVSKR